MLSSSQKYKKFHKTDVCIRSEIVRLVHGHEQDKIYCRTDQSVKRSNNETILCSYLPTYLSVCLSVRLSIRLSIYLSV